MPTIFITGSSSGIGRASVEYFSDKGWQVAASMRNPEKEDVLNNLKNVRLYKLDVTDEQSIKSAIELAIGDFGGIDVLVNNAGYGAIGAFEAATKEQVEKQFNTNVFGLMNVTREILPHFRRQHRGTIINVASVGGRMTFPLYSLYHGTKWAVEGFSESLNFELKQFGIRVKIIEPGPIKTDFYNRSQDLIKKPGLVAYDKYSSMVLPQMQKAGKNAQGPEIVAHLIYKAATDNNNRIRYAVGAGAPFLLFIRRILPETWFMAIIRKVLER